MRCSDRPLYLGRPDVRTHHAEEVLKNFLLVMTSLFLGGAWYCAAQIHDLPAAMAPTIILGFGAGWHFHMWLGEGK